VLVIMSLYLLYGVFIDVTLIKILTITVLLIVKIFSTISRVTNC